MKHSVGIIGYGGMGSWHHNMISKENLELVTSTAYTMKEKQQVNKLFSMMEVVATYDVRQEPLKKAKKNGLKTYTALIDFLNDDSIELVIIAIPNNFHKACAIAALRAGKHVVCEKPVTMNASELAEIMIVAKETGKVFSVHQNRRWDRDYCSIKKIIDDGIIGAPYYIQSRVQGSRRSLHGWRGYAVNGGGMVYDWASHLIDQMIMMIDSAVVSVNAQLFQIHSSEVEDNINITLRFENGVGSLIQVDTNCFITQPRWHISCTDGTAEIRNWECEGSIVKLANGDEMEWDSDIVYTAAGPTRTMTPRPKSTTKSMDVTVVQTDWSEYYQNVIQTMEGHSSLLVTTEQVLRTMKVIDAVFESHNSGGSVSCHI